MKITIRRARVADAEAIAALLGGLGKEFRTTTSRAARRLRRTTDTVFLAVAGREPLGLVSVGWYQPVHADYRYGRIVTIVVRRDRHRQGVGRALIRHALSHLRRLGCRKVELTSRTYRGGAHSFYRAMGFNLTAMRFSRKL